MKINHGKASAFSSLYNERPKNESPFAALAMERSGRKKIFA
ncbi:MAG: hypothetical protein ACP5M0_04200 [Desulfomonilaceae bacterium]